MFSIATLTLNPTVDMACEVERVVDTHKMRASGEYYNPGGGGINVARVFVRLGGNARSIYTSGGPIGVALDGLIDRHQLARVRIPVGGDTRAAQSVLERSTGREYRFVPAGPELAESEWQAALEALQTVKCDYLVASGSLPRGVPDDFYARAAAIAADRGKRFVLDTSGRALRGSLGGGPIHLLKPSLSEFCQLVGREVETLDEIAQHAVQQARRCDIEMLAVTLGHRGAVLARESGALYLPALPIKARSAVGAGDSFTAAMVYRLCAGDEPEAAFCFAVAAGAAAVCNPGTQLSQPDDIARLLPQVMEPRPL
jgi:6-phosphofructokinase 2